VNKTSFESTAQDDDLQQVRDAGGISVNDTSETGKKSAVKQPPKTVPTRNFFAPLRTNGMDTETTGAENTTGEGGFQNIRWAVTFSDDFYRKPHWNIKRPERTR
jgi:hypothetical protein